MKILRRGLFMAGCVYTASLAWGQGGFGGPGTYEISNVKSGRLLDLDTRDRATLVQGAQRNNDLQRWIVSDAAPGYFYIRNVATGKALELIQDSNGTPVLARSSEANPNQHWKIEPGKDGNAILVSRFGKALDVPDGSDREGLRLQVYDKNGDSNQRFGFRRIAGVVTSIVRPTDRDSRNRPDSTGRFFDDRDRMWKMAGDGVCFYRDTDFRGEAICARAGENLADVGREAGGAAFLSVKFFGRARDVTIYERPAMRGAMFRITRDTSDLRRVRASWTDSVGEKMGSFGVK